MKDILVMTLFLVAMLAWAAAQQASGAPEVNGGQLLPRVRRRRAQFKLNIGSADPAGSQD